VHAVSTAFTGLCVANPRKSELCKHLLILSSGLLAPRREALSFSLFLHLRMGCWEDVGNCSPFKSLFNSHQVKSKARPNTSKNNVTRVNGCPAILSSPLSKFLPFRRLTCPQYRRQVEYAGLPHIASLQKTVFFFFFFFLGGGWWS